MLSIEKRIDESGVKPNKYRVAILDYLLKMKNHPTPAVIFSHMKQQYPNISLATIYNTLQIFKEKGLVISFQGTDDAEHYDANTGTHFHFLCENCGAIIDIDAGEDFEIKLPKELEGSVIERSSINLFGRCSSCKKI